MNRARLAVTGIASFLGSRVLAALAEARGGDSLVAVDIEAPRAVLGVRHRAIDLTEPASGERLRDALREDEVRTVVHAAMLTNPRRDGAYAHELESIGTLNVLAAAAAAGVGHVVLRSFTAVYGARGTHPAYLTEDRPPHPDLSLGWVRDKVEAEQHAASFARRYPAMKFTVLRMAPLFGPGVRTFYTAIFDHRVVPVLMGFDPLVQLLHPEDALAALVTAIERPVGGVFNIVPSRPIPLLAALHLAARIPLPVPHPIAYPAADLLWAAGLSGAPGRFIDFVRYPFLGDGEKARRELPFTARHSSREALEAYLGDRRTRAALRAAEAGA
jgi:UDP-glucose 4-epimerase